MSIRRRFRLSVKKFQRSTLSLEPDEPIRPPLSPSARSRISSDTTGDISENKIANEYESDRTIASASNSTNTISSITNQQNDNIDISSSSKNIAEDLRLLSGFGILHTKLKMNENGSSQSADHKKLINSMSLQNGDSSRKERDSNSSSLDRRDSFNKMNKSGISGSSGSGNNRTSSSNESHSSNLRDRGSGSLRRQNNKRETGYNLETTNEEEEAPIRNRRDSARQKKLNVGTLDDPDSTTRSSLKNKRPRSWHSSNSSLDKILDDSSKEKSPPLKSGMTNRSSRKKNLQSASDGKDHQHKRQSIRNRNGSSDRDRNSNSIRKSSSERCPRSEKYNDQEQDKLDRKSTNTGSSYSSSQSGNNTVTGTASKTMSWSEFLADSRNAPGGGKHLKPSGEHMMVGDGKQSNKDIREVSGSGGKRGTITRKLSILDRLMQKVSIEAHEQKKRHLVTKIIKWSFTG